MLRLVYFASVREALGCDAEEHDVPSSATTIGNLIDHLATTEPRYRKAFADRSRLRFALDTQMAKPDALLADVKELAIFPPVTGG